MVPGNVRSPPGLVVRLEEKEDAMSMEAYVRMINDFAKMKKISVDEAAMIILEVMSEFEEWRLGRKGEVR